MLIMWEHSVSVVSSRALAYFDTISWGTYIIIWWHSNQTISTQQCDTLICTDRVFHTIYPQSCQYLTLLGEFTINTWSDHGMIAFNNIYRIFTVAQTRHFIKHLLHDFTKHLLHDFTKHLLHDFTKHLLHDFTKHLLHEFTKHLLHDFTKHFLHDFIICSAILQNICSTIL